MKKCLVLLIASLLVLMTLSCIKKDEPSQEDELELIDEQGQEIEFK